MKKIALDLSWGRPESTGRSDLQHSHAARLKSLETTNGVSNESVAEVTNGESATLGLALMALANEGDGGSSTVPMTAYPSLTEKAMAWQHRYNQKMASYTV